MLSAWSYKWPNASASPSIETLVVGIATAVMAMQPRAWLMCRSSASPKDAEIDVDGSCAGCPLSPGRRGYAVHGGEPTAPGHLRSFLQPPRLGRRGDLWR